MIRESSLRAAYSLGFSDRRPLIGLFFELRVFLPRYLKSASCSWYSSFYLFFLAEDLISSLLLASFFFFSAINELSILCLRSHSFIFLELYQPGRLWWTDKWYPIIKKWRGRLELIEKIYLDYFYCYEVFLIKEFISWCWWNDDNSSQQENCYVEKSTKYEM